MTILRSNPVWERVPFSVYSLVSVEVRPVSKNCSCSWSARAPDCPSLPVRSCLLADQYSPAHFCMGLGETKCYISLYSQLFISHSPSTWDSYDSVSVNGWVGVNASKFVTLRTVASFSAGIYFPLHPSPERAAEVFLLSTDIWLVH